MSTPYRGHPKARRNEIKAYVQARIDGGEDNARRLSRIVLDEFDVDWAASDLQSSFRDVGVSLTRAPLDEGDDGIMYTAPKQVSRTAPGGWEPGVAWDGPEGVLTSGPLTERPDAEAWQELLAVWDLDPTIYEIVEPVQYRAWDASIGDGEVRRMYYFRATVRRRVSEHADDTVEDVAKLIAEWTKQFPKHAPLTGELAMVVNFADWQTGKGEGGGGFVLHSFDFDA